MKTYNILLSEYNESYWEDLSNDQKNQLVNAYILSKPINIPAQTEYQRIVFNAMNKEHFSAVDEVSIKALFFQAIKERIELDLENEWVELNSKQIA